MGDFEAQKFFRAFQKKGLLDFAKITSLKKVSGGHSDAIKQNYKKTRKFLESIGRGFKKDSKHLHMLQQYYLETASFH